jgi:hypothetical protein
MAGNTQVLTAPGEIAEFVRSRMPEAGLFAGQSWHTATAPFELETAQAKQLQGLGRVLLQFYRALNLLYRKSAEGKQPSWIAEWLDQGKPAEIVELQRSAALKNELPRVIRPDLLLGEAGFRITELDSVPGGIGLTGWLNQTYSDAGFPVMGGKDVMVQGFSRIFGDAPAVHIIVSDEAGSYRPEMEWISNQIDPARFKVQGPGFTGVADGDAVYRFFELFDLANVPAAKHLFELALAQRIRLTPPPKSFFEEKMAFALLWNKNLEPFWRQELGESFFQKLLQLVPRTWIIDSFVLPPQAAYPGVDLTNWQQLKTLSQKKRDFILKVSGFSPEAWGARGVYLGSDLPQAEWSAAVDNAIASYERSPYILQPYEKTRLVPISYYDKESAQAIAMQGRARICPYYFVAGDGDAARAELGGVLATVCPADKKIIHGMSDAVLAPCVAAAPVE